MFAIGIQNIYITCFCYTLRITIFHLQNYLPCSMLVGTCASVTHYDLQFEVFKITLSCSRFVGTCNALSLMFYSQQLTTKFKYLPSLTSGQLPTCPSLYFLPHHFICRQCQPVNAISYHQFLNNKQ